MSLAFFLTQIKTIKEINWLQQLEKLEMASALLLPFSCN